MPESPRADRERFWAVFRPVASYAGVLAVAVLVLVLGYQTLFVRKAPPAEKKVEFATPATTQRQASGEVEAEQAMPNFAKDLAELTRHPHRLAGSPFGQEAADYIQKRLRDMGLAEVYAQRVPVVRRSTEDVNLSVDGGPPQPLYACRPDLIAASVTPEEGITGPTVYARTGRLEDYGPTAPYGRIVVLDFATSVDNWQSAFAMGAKAVIFVGDGEPAARTWFHINLPGILPRFYLPADQADRLGLRQGSHQVSLHSRARWRNSRRNVIGVIRGKNTVYNQNAPEAVILAAPIDSYGEVPDLAAGARGAANAAALLGMAEFLKDNQPGRDVILCFFDGQGQYNAGAMAFYGAIMRRLKNDEFAESLEQQAGRIHAELSYIQEVLGDLDLPDASRMGAKAREELKQVTSNLNNGAARQAPGCPHPRGGAGGGDGAAGRGDQRAGQEPLDSAGGPVFDPEAQTRREPAEGLSAQTATGGQPPRDIQQRLDALKRSRQAAQEARDRYKQLQDECDQANILWSQLRREWTKPIVISAATAKYLQAAKDELRRLKQVRVEELNRAEGFNQDAVRIRQAVGNDFIVLHLSLDFAESWRRWTFVHGDRVRPNEGSTSGRCRGQFRPAGQLREPLQGRDGVDQAAGGAPGRLGGGLRRPGDRHGRQRRADLLPRPAGRRRRRGPCVRRVQPGGRDRLRPPPARRPAGRHAGGHARPPGQHRRPGDATGAAAAGAVAVQRDERLAGDRAGRMVLAGQVGRRADRGRHGQDPQQRRRDGRRAGGGRRYGDHPGRSVDRLDGRRHRRGHPGLRAIPVRVGGRQRGRRVRPGLQVVLQHPDVRLRLRPVRRPGRAHAHQQHRHGGAADVRRGRGEGLRGQGHDVHRAGLRPRLRRHRGAAGPVHRAVPQGLLADGGDHQPGGGVHPALVGGHQALPPAGPGPAGQRRLPRGGPGRGPAQPVRLALDQPANRPGPLAAGRVPPGDAARQPHHGKLAPDAPQPGQGNPPAGVRRCAGIAAVRQRPGQRDDPPGRVLPPDLDHPVGRRCARDRTAFDGGRAGGPSQASRRSGGLRRGQPPGVHPAGERAERPGHGRGVAAAAGHAVCLRPGAAADRHAAHLPPDRLVTLLFFG